ncbi:hypothetical protein H5410_047187 [Solanum commersonii]|uniref:Uncharacterized protein n=1 Tax=Solanum commersonii TaxID=4109 RepID=A0A9J5XEC7_SOLCO|nr:hypothetical protein H5410_047187 [Solanum commersonii]
MLYASLSSANTSAILGLRNASLSTDLEAIKAAFLMLSVSNVPFMLSSTISNAPACKTKLKESGDPEWLSGSRPQISSRRTTPKLKVLTFNILDAYVSPLLLRLMYNNTDIKTTNRTNTAPPTAPSITMKRLWRLCFVGAKTVTCGVSIVGFLENSLHKDIVKTCKLSLFKDCGRGPCSLLFSRFLNVTARLPMFCISPASEVLCKSLQQEEPQIKADPGFKVYEFTCAEHTRTCKYNFNFTQGRKEEIEEFHFGGVDL